MITGTLNAKSGTEMYIADDRKLQNISVRSGQYLYLSVHDCWIPVIIRFSPESKSWVFQDFTDSPALFLISQSLKREFHRRNLLKELRNPSVPM